MKEIKKVWKSGKSLLVVIPQDVCTKLKIVKGNHILVDFIRKVRK